MTPAPFTSPSRSPVALVAFSALVTLACFGLASCGGGPGTVHPDLVVEGLKVNHLDATASFMFSATVRNAGDGSAAATTLRFYRSEDELITPSDEQVGDAPVPALAASASRVVTVTVTAPPGTYYYGACVDPVAGESDTANGCSTAVQVPVAAQDTPRPDLVVKSPAVSPDGPAARTSLTFSATVRNDGDGSAEAATLRVYRSDDETITRSDEQVGEDAVPALAALEEHAASVDLSAPSSAGTYYYGACVQEVAEESDAANNCSAPAQVTVQAPPVGAPGLPVASESPRPDLVLAGAWVENSNPAAGGVFELSTEIHNHGPTTALDVTLRFYRSTDATIERSDTEFTTRRDVMGINEYNYELYVNMYVKAPSSNGVYYYGACVDEVDRESDTTNNCSAAVKVVVSHDKPELRVRSWAVLAILRTGAFDSLATSVTNFGGPSEATTLRLLLLPDRESAPSAGTQVGEVDVPELVVTSDAPASSLRFVAFQAPATAGRYYYVMCVDAVARESDATNNCSGPPTSVVFVDTD